MRNTSDKMGDVMLLLMFLSVPGLSYVLQPPTQVAPLHGHHRSQEEAAELDVRVKSEKDHGIVGLFSEMDMEMEHIAENIDKIIAEFGQKLGESLQIHQEYETPEMLPEDLWEESRGGETPESIEPENLLKNMNREEKRDQMMQENVAEELKSRLVAGIGLREGHEEREKGEEEGGDIKNANQNETEGDHIDVSNLTPPLRTSSAQQGKEIKVPATNQAFIQTQSPPTSPPFHYNVPPSVLVTPTQAPENSSPQSVTPNPGKKSASTAAPGVGRSIFLLEDLLSEVFQSPGHHFKQNELEEEKTNLEGKEVKSMFFKPAWKQETTSDINTKEAEVLAATPKPKEETKDLDKPRPALTNENNHSVKLNLVENGAKAAAKQNKSAQTQLVKPSAKPQRVTAKSSTNQTKQNKSNKNKSVNKKVGEKKKKKDNKTPKAPKKKKEEAEPTHFPYFKDDYCPPECACYGRVVQCSDKGVDKVPYGIPYNARYILLMNNRINSIQLDLLSEYVSMEFLVLSNNRLTDGSTEGAFEGIPALKRLYLDRNLLESIPTDLPLSLEELRLDNNQLSVMSAAAWARCPGLLVLSLSNNSLGNGSESLPDAVLTPLSNLRTLNLDHNQLKSVPLGLPLSIKELYFKGNLIENFRGGAFDGKSELVLLDLSSNRLTNKGLLRESLVNATHLESLNLEGNRLKQVPKHLPRSLKTLNLEGNLISSIKKSVFNTLKHLEHLGLARNKIFKVAPGAFRALPALHQLDLCHNTLRQVPRQLPQALHSVALTHNRIQSVPRDAFCWGNRSVSLSGLVRVQLENNLIDMGRLDGQAFRCLRGFQVVHFY